MIHIAQFKDFLKQKTNIYIIILTLIGSFLRLVKLRSSLFFLGDQGRDVIIVRNLLVHLDPILVGPTTSVGKIQLGPLYYYFMAPWLLLSNFDPIGPAFGNAIVGIITIPILYYVIKRMFNTSTGLISATFYTFAAVIIQNTRFSWNPNPMPIIIILLLWGVYEVYKHQRYKFLILIWSMFAVAIQLHYMALLITPFLGVMHLLFLFDSIEKKLIKNSSHNLKSYLALLKNPKTISILKFSLISGAIFLIFQIPLIIFDLRHDFLNTKGFIEFFQKGHHTNRDLIQSIQGLEGRMFQTLGMPLGMNIYLDFRDVMSWIIFLVFSICTWLNKKNKSIQIIFLYLIFAILGLGVYSGDVFPHYLGFVFPIPFIIISILLSYIWNMPKHLGKIISLVIFSIFIWFNSLHLDIYKPVGVQIDDIENVSQIIATDAKDSAFNILLHDDSKDYRCMNYRYYLEKENAQVLPLTDFHISPILYLISQREIIDLTDIETREFEDFLGVRMLQLDTDEEKQQINSMITKQWQFDNGYYLYKIEKDHE